VKESKGGPFRSTWGGGVADLGTGRRGMCLYVGSLNEGALH